jgi:pimeloyl-ACP methyl ester carboxylesterase
MSEITLTHGTIHYRDEGAGAPIVLIHGVLVNGAVWDRVLPALSAHGRVIVPELPLGAHTTPMNLDADLTPPGLAALIAELLERLGLQDVTLVGNDTGGALCQLVVANHPQRIARLVLTNCDAFEHFPPEPFALPMKALGRVPGAVALFADMGRLGPLRRASMALTPLTVEPIPDALLKEWVTPLRRRAIRRDVVKVLRGISPTHTLGAVDRLRAFEAPVLLVWGRRDPYFPFADAQRLAGEVFPDARIQEVDDARAFVQMDAPARLAELITTFATADRDARVTAAAAAKGG